MPTPLSAGALAGTKVIDLTRVLGGPYATQVFADHGADVIKVEPPQGDEVRVLRGVHGDPHWAELLGQLLDCSLQDFCVLFSTMFRPACSVVAFALPVFFITFTTQCV